MLTRLLWGLAWIGIGVDGAALVMTFFPRSPIFLVLSMILAGTVSAGVCTNMANARERRDREDSHGE